AHAVPSERQGGLDIRGGRIGRSEDLEGEACGVAAGLAVGGVRRDQPPGDRGKRPAAEVLPLGEVAVRDERVFLVRPEEPFQRRRDLRQLAGGAGGGGAG